MKTTRRILSMVLVLMMVLSLSVTAFADGVTPRVEVTIQPSDGTTSTSTLYGTEGQSLYNLLDDTNEADWETVNDYYQPGVTHEALVSYKGYASQGISNTEIDRAKLQAKGYSYDSISWLGNSHPGYGLISTSTSGETTSYTYIYAGYDWTYKNADGEIWTYMCCYDLEADDVIQLTYAFGISVWTTTTPIV